MSEPVDNLPKPVKFLYAGESYIAWAKHWLETEPDLTRVARRERLMMFLRHLAGAGALGFFCFLAVMQNSQPDLKRFAYVAAILIVIPFLLYALQGGAWCKYRKSIRKIAAQRESPGTYVTVSVTREGIQWKTDAESTLYRWKRFDEVTHFDGYVGLVPAEQFGFVAVPTSAFDSDEEARQWEERVRQLHDESGYGVASRVKALVHTRRVRCGRCGHSLAGLRDPVCPECGVQVTPKRLKMWYALQYPIRGWLFPSRQDFGGD